MRWVSLVRKGLHDTKKFLLMDCTTLKNSSFWAFLELFIHNGNCDSGVYYWLGREGRCYSLAGLALSTCWDWSVLLGVMAGSIPFGEGLSIYNLR